MKHGKSWSMFNLIRLFWFYKGIQWEIMEIISRNFSQYVDSWLGDQRRDQLRDRPRALREVVRGLWLRFTRCRCGVTLCGIGLWWWGRVALTDVASSYKWDRTVRVVTIAPPVEIKYRLPKVNPWNSNHTIRWIKYTTQSVGKHGVNESMRWNGSCGNEIGHAGTK
jgi:hypothetical protein